jgi:hypothetical protein
LAFSTKVCRQTSTSAHIVSGGQPAPESRFTPTLSAGPRSRSRWPAWSFRCRWPR